MKTALKELSDELEKNKNTMTEVLKVGSRSQTEQGKGAANNRTKAE